MARIGVAVEELDPLFGRVHHRVVDPAPHEHGAHRHRGIRDPLRDRHHVRLDVEVLRREWRADPAEAGDDLVEDEENVVLRADRANALEIALWWNEHACGAGDWLDDYRRDRRRAMSLYQLLQ